LVIVKPASGKHRIIVPIPVAAITVLVETVGFWGPALARLGVRLPNGVGKHLERIRSDLERLPVDLKSDHGESVLISAISSIEELWQELISYGSWDVVDIKTSSGDRVLVRFI